MDSGLSIKNATGKTFSLLNDNKSTFKVNKLTSTTMNLPLAPKRKYHCTEIGCNKSFTTSGHLARHNRIHTGEKNFHCLHPGCPSRFSRQDNMMQHYRTHLSQKFRRHQMRQQQQKKGIKEDEIHSAPQLYCHSYYGRENGMSFQPLMNRHRAATMPSLPYPTITMQSSPKTVNRPRRALSTSSTCSSSSSSSFSPPPAPPAYYDFQQHCPTILPPPMPFINQPMIPHQHYHRDEHRHHEWTSNTQKSSSLLQLANIVSTFG